MSNEKKDYTCTTSRFVYFSRILMTGLDGGLNPMELYGTCERAGVQLPLNSRFTTESYPCDGECIYQYVSDWSTPGGGWANWLVGLHAFVTRS